METMSHPRTSATSFVRAVVVDYFSPLIDLLRYLNTSNFKSSHAASAAISELATRASQVTAKAVCLNQGRYLEFAYLAADLHRTLREATQRRKQNVDEIATAASALVDYMNRGFYSAAQANFELLQAYFEGRADALPRVCIKGNFRFGTSETVVTVFRDSQVDYLSNAAVGRNSGFAHVHRTGRYFLENDIPAAAGRDGYFNPRLDNDKVKILVRKPYLDDDWIRCWAGAESLSDTYKSTLIVPMTLWNNQLNEEFKRRVRIKNIGRTIFGYLCLDHVESNFFRKEPDVSVGYIFADLLSMYVFSRVVNIDVSATFDAAAAILSQNGLHREATRLSDGIESTYRKAHRSPSLRFDLLPSKENSLVSLDEDLLRFIGLSQEDVAAAENPAH